MVSPAVDLIIQFGVMFAVGAGMGLALIFISHVFAPHSVNPSKSDAYECGVVPTEDARRPWNVHYYMVGVLFVIFDLEAVFMYPWAIALREVGSVALGGMSFFILLLLIGFFYEWKKGVLKWE